MSRIPRWSRFLPVLIVFVLLGAMAAQAQVEITPFAGYRIGGDLEDFDFAGVDLDDSESYGLVVDIDVGGGFQVELMYGNQDTALTSSRLFEPDTILDLEVEYIHGGVLYQWEPGGDVLPFIVGTIGVTRLIPDGPGYVTEDRFSGSIGGGVKLMISDHIGFRFEGRGFSTVVDDGDDAFCERGDRDCYRYRYDNEILWQLEARAGLILRF